MRIHAYSGKEDGLLLIASASEWKSRVEELLSRLKDQPERAPRDGPPELCRRSVQAAQESADDYKVSMHLETSLAKKPAGQARPLLIRIALIVFALIGVWQCLVWIRALLP
jgi:hypothetical protein